MQGKYDTKIVNRDMNYSYPTTMYEKEISIHTVVMSHGAGKVTYHTYGITNVFSKYGK